MKKELLLAANIDYENGKKRFAGNTALYEKYLLKFREDKHFNEAMAAYDKEDYGTAYGVGLKKAFSHVLTMKKEGYNTAVVVFGDLENEGAVDKQVNWELLPENVKKVQEHAPELAMMFLYAHPEKLDMVKEKLTPVLGEKKLVLSPEQNSEKAIRQFLKALGR